jgi:hypothetical protein
MTSVQSTARVSARSGVQHVRHRHAERFTVVGNHLAQNRKLSLVAIGIAVYVQSLPDGVPVGIRELTARFHEGEVAIARALRELEAEGYLKRERLRLTDGRMVTRTTYFERPGAAPAVVRKAAPRPEPRPKPASRPESRPEPAAPVDPVASAVLGRLRLRDERLVLSERAVRRLAPGVSRWLQRGLTPDRIAATLCGSLPNGEISSPERLVEWRLKELMPPALPTALRGPAGRPPGPARPDPMQCCQGCDRGFRAPGPGYCRDCREAAAAA